MNIQAKIESTKVGRGGWRCHCCGGYRSRKHGTLLRVLVRRAVRHAINAEVRKASKELEEAS